VSKLRRSGGDEERIQQLLVQRARRDAGEEGKARDAEEDEYQQQGRMDKEMKSRLGRGDVETHSKLRHGGEEQIQHYQEKAVRLDATGEEDEREEDGGEEKLFL